MKRALLFDLDDTLVVSDTPSRPKKSDTCCSFYMVAQ
jgi:hypothetical protein